MNSKDDFGMNLEAILFAKDDFFKDDLQTNL